MKKNKILLISLISLLVAGSMFLGSCDMDKGANNGVVRVENVSGLPGNFQLFEGGTKLIERVVANNQSWDVSGCPTGVNLKIIVGSNVASTDEFKLKAKQKRTFEFSSSLVFTEKK